MQAVNIRQLKTKPSTALAAARADDMVVVMNRDRPQALLSGLGIPLTGEGKASAADMREDMREEMRGARDWLTRPA